MKPEVTKSCGAPASSMVAMAPKRAPVSDRALSTTSRSTVSRSRLALMRRLAVLSAELRSRSASFSRLRSRPVIRSSLHLPRAVLPARSGADSPTDRGRARLPRFDPVCDRSRLNRQVFVLNSRKTHKKGHHCHTIVYRTAITILCAPPRYGPPRYTGRKRGGLRCLRRAKGRRIFTGFQRIWRQQ